MTTGSIQPNKRTENVSSNRRRAKKSPDTKTIDKEKQKRRNTFITAISISLVILLIIGIAYYLFYVMPFQRVILKVENDTVKIDYFLKRAFNTSSDDPIGDTMNALEYELVVMQEAPKYNIVVTEEDIDTALRDMAKGDSESITDDEFNEWYRQRLNTSQFSDKQFRDLIRRILLQQRMAQLIADNTPSVAEHVHLSIIVVKTYEEAKAVKTRVDNGEEFASLARELSLDTESGQNGGDIGWYPLGILEDRFQFVLADLPIGKCSDPVTHNIATENSTTDTQNLALFMISERDVAKEVDPELLQSLKAKAYNDWLNEQLNNKVTKRYGIHGGYYDSVTQAWLNYQLQRMTEGISSSSTE
jgi:foldase protein PrsA